jgi:hypothetical protein
VVDWDELYAERGVPTEWADITPEQMRPAYSLHWKALKSPSGNLEGTEEYWRSFADPDGEPHGPPDEAEELIHNPVHALRRAGLISENGPTPHVSTMIVNHERTLERFIVYAMVLVSTNPNTVGITLAKEEYPEQGSAQAS